MKDFYTITILFSVGKERIGAFQAVFSVSLGRLLGLGCAKSLFSSPRGDFVIWVWNLSSFRIWQGRRQTDWFRNVVFSTLALKTNSKKIWLGVNSSLFIHKGRLINDVSQLIFIGCDYWSSKFHVRKNPMILKEKLILELIRFVLACQRLEVWIWTNLLSIPL